MRKIPEERKERNNERHEEIEKEREREGKEETEAPLRQRAASCCFIFSTSRFVVENARLATTFSNDNNYPGETSLPIRRERLLFFIYGQAHYFCASKHMKNSPLARSSPPFPFSPFARRGYRPVQRPSHGFIKLVATMRRLSLSFSFSFPSYLTLALCLSLLPCNFVSRTTVRMPFVDPS